MVVKLFVVCKGDEVKLVLVYDDIVVKVKFESSNIVEVFLEEVEIIVVLEIINGFVGFFGDGEVRIDGFDGFLLLDIFLINKEYFFCKKVWMIVIEVVDEVL